MSDFDNLLEIISKTRIKKLTESIYYDPDKFKFKEDEINKS